MASTLIVFLALGLFLSASSQDACVPRSFGRDSFVCVCNSTYCDSTPRFVPAKGQYAYYQSSRDGQRFNEKTGHFQNGPINVNESTIITINLFPDEGYQTMYGFGGAFTDSTGINFMNMSHGSQRNIIESYFGVNGSRYTLGRVPIAGTDFSTGPYSYDDYDDDVGLTKFALSCNDYQYKIPLMKQARILSPGLRFISAAWSAPYWMKTNCNITGFGFLADPYYQVYAEYLTKFLEEYRNEGLDIWAITSGNEPSMVDSPRNDYNSMGWSPQGLARFVAENLAPTIARSTSNDTVILIIDDQRYALPWDVVDIYQNVAAYNATVGIAVHWYFDRVISVQVLDLTQAIYPDRFMLLTEGCVGNSPLYRVPVELGDWGRAETYMTDLIQNYQHWVTGYIDWNMVLDRQGGPNWAKNFVDAPIIVNPETDEFFKQPTYYALAHFSKFIPPGSVRMGFKQTNSNGIVPFLTPENETVVVLYNQEIHNVTVLVTDPEQGHIWIEMSPKSIGTLIYQR